MEREGFACGGEPTVGVEQFLVGVKAFFVVGDQLCGDVGFIALVQFAHITDVKFGSIGRVVVGFDIVWPKADVFIDFIDGCVEKDGIISHVEVAVIVDPFGKDVFWGGAEGGLHGVGLWSFCLL